MLRSRDPVGIPQGRSLSSHPPFRLRLTLAFLILAVVGTTVGAAVLFGSNQAAPTTVEVADIGLTGPPVVGGIDLNPAAAEAAGSGMRLGVLDKSAAREEQREAAAAREAAAFETFARAQAQAIADYAAAVAAAAEAPSSPPPVYVPPSNDDGNGGGCAEVVEATTARRGGGGGGGGAAAVAGRSTRSWTTSPPASRAGTPGPSIPRGRGTAPSSSASTRGSRTAAGATAARTSSTTTTSSSGRSPPTWPEPGASPARGRPAPPATATSEPCSPRPRLATSSSATGWRPAVRSARTSSSTPTRSGASPGSRASGLVTTWSRSAPVWGP